MIQDQPFSMTIMPDSDLRVSDPLDLTLAESSLRSLSGYRQSAFQALVTSGIPGQHMEEWKYTPVKSQLDLVLHTPASIHAGTGPDSPFRAYLEAAQEEKNYRRLVLYNGIFQPQLSDSLEGTGITAMSFTDALDSGLYQPEIPEPPKSPSAKPGQKTSYFTLLNQANGGRGVFISHLRPTTEKVWLHIDHIFDHETPAILHTRNMIYLGVNCSLNLVETNHFKNSTVHIVHNAYTVFNLSQGARAEHVLIQKGTEHSATITRENVEMGRDSKFSMHTYTLSGRFTRNDLTLSLNEPGAEGHMYGFYQPGGAELCDNHTLADHRSPNCESNELYKGILRGRSIGVFNGKVFVHPDAQKTNAYQQNNSIILEDEASMNSKPELEIYADDVKCSHGSTVGQLDETAMFYLRSRGIGEAAAKALLVHAFADELLASLENETLAAYLTTEIV